MKTLNSVTSDSEIEAAAARLVRTASRSIVSADPWSTIHKAVGVRSTVGVDVLGLIDGRPLGDRDVGLAVCGSFDGDIGAETVGSADVGAVDSDGLSDGFDDGAAVGGVVVGLGESAAVGGVVVGLGEGAAVGGVVVGPGEGVAVGGVVVGPGEGAAVGRIGGSAVGPGEGADVGGIEGSA